MARQKVIDGSRPPAAGGSPEGGSAGVPPGQGGGFAGGGGAAGGGGSPFRDDSLRPGKLEDVVGQQEVVDRLRISLHAARLRGEPLQHLLLDGPPGLGKTTLAGIIPRELGVPFVMTSGPALNRPADVMPYLTNLAERAVLFIDEIHRLPRAVEEFIYPAMEDFRVDIVLGEGLGARTLSMPLKKFTLIGATTRSGMLTGPLRDRFILREHLDFYSDAELGRIVANNARKLALQIDDEGIIELAKRSRGTPRIANSLLYWVRDFAFTATGNAVADADIVRRALHMRGVDIEGLDRQDRRFLDTLIRVFGGGPTGVEALAATMNVPVDTLSEEVEPFLLRKEFIVRTPRGRQATPRAFEHLGTLPPGFP
jgi:Holliday junction DNA helicase RuvB